MQTSAEQVPSLHRVAPWYLKPVTSSNFWLFMLMSALALFMLLVIILLFSVLTSIALKISPSDCSRGLHCWSSHTVPKWLEPGLPLC